MKFWWLIDIARVSAEKAAVEKLAEEEGWFTISRWRLNAYRLSVEGVISAHGFAYPVRLIYPDQFPSVPPWVEPQDPEARWSNHQYGKGGSLCLELRPDNWSAEATGADMLRSAYNLLETENPLGEDHGKVPSSHHTGGIQAYEWGKIPFIIGAGCFQRLLDGIAENLQAVYSWADEEKRWPILLSDAEDLKKPSHPPTENLIASIFKMPVFVSHANVPDPIPSDRAAFASAVGIEVDSSLDDKAVAIIVVGTDRIIPYHSPDKGSLFERSLAVLPDDYGLRSGRTGESAGKRVAIVGVGSVGSKIAETLLRSGIYRQVLVDGDVFLPANMERHCLDWRDVGFRKATALKRRLLNIIPGADIKAIPVNLNWQTSARLHADNVDSLASCDLIVDATGDIPTALFLAAIAAANEKPFVSVQVFEGGLGALLARSIPGRDASYITGLQSYTAYCEREGVAPPRSGHRSYEALAETGIPLVADDAAVSIAAAHGARMILDIMDGQVDPTDTAWMLIGVRKGWLFSRHGDTLCLDVGSASPGTSEVASGEPETRGFIAGLLKEVVDEASASQ